jgi:hypothetical protein
MDGILEELLRLEDAKHHALIDFDPVAYENSVRQQERLVDGIRLSASSASDTETLVALSKLAGINAGLYHNLLSTTPWLVPHKSSYSGNGHLSEPVAAGGFRVEG